MTLAQQLPRGLIEQEVLQQGYEIMLKELGRKSANYYFYTHEDYPSDLVNEYFYIQKELECS
jgi:hypothetical protein